MGKGEKREHANRQIGVLTQTLVESPSVRHLERNRQTKMRKQKKRHKDNVRETERVRKK